MSTRDLIGLWVALAVMTTTAVVEAFRRDGDLAVIVFSVALGWCGGLVTRQLYDRRGQ